jgi:predicted RNase H-like HicB family nuclease
MALKALTRFRPQEKPEPGAVQLRALLTVAVWPEGDKWLSECLELGVGSFGSNPDEAMEEAIDAIGAYLNTLEELGERERVFAEKSIPTYVIAPAEFHLPHVPRALAERKAIQFRPFEAPIVFA